MSLCLIVKLNSLVNRKSSLALKEYPIISFTYFQVSDNFLNLSKIILLIASRCRIVIEVSLCPTQYFCPCYTIQKDQDVGEPSCQLEKGLLRKVVCSLLQIRPFHPLHPLSMLLRQRLTCEESHTGSLSPHSPDPK